MACDTTVILTPTGLISLNVSQKYQVDEILDLDDTIIKTFAEILHLSESKRYPIIYTLALNNLLITPSTDVNCSLEWVHINRQILMIMDELLVSENGEFKIPHYGLSFTGKRSGLFNLLSLVIKTIKNPSNIGLFERSFHLSPAKFIGGSDRIDNHLEFRNKIKTAIQSNFILNETMIETTFNLIDKFYFSDLLRYRLQAAGKKLLFRISHQITSTAGSMKNKFHQNEYIITIAAKLNEVIGNKLSSGISVNGPIDAFIVTLQHEISHLIVSLEMDRLGITSSDLTDNSKKLSINPDAFKSHGSIFQNISERFFGLTERTHHLFESDNETNSIDHPKVNPDKLKVGFKVYFDNKGTLTYGKILKINPKRAKVKTDNGSTFSVAYQILYLV